MSNIITYANKIKHLSFHEEPLTIVDSLILSQLAYLSYDGIVPSYEENKPSLYFKELSQYKDDDFLFHGIIMGKETKALFEEIVDSKRYGNMRINYYVNQIETKQAKQFSGITFLVDQLFTYIAFRGTDVSVVGWKEDFNMTFQSPVPAQISAMHYLNAIAHLTRGDLYISGHSKGGNLAVYAAMHANEDIAHKIIKIFNHDGPGFQKEVLESTLYQRIKNKLVVVLPHSSVVGMLLQQDEDYMVVKSHRFWIMQHDPFSWLVEGNTFSVSEDLSYKARLFSEGLNEWLNDIDNDRRAVFVETLFQLIEATGEEDFESLLSNNKVVHVHTILKAMKDVDPEVKRFCLKAFISLVGHVIDKEGKEQLNHLHLKWKRNGSL